MSKPEKGNWDEDFKQDSNNTSDSSKPKTEYMDMTKPGDYTIRLVGPHIKCRKHFKPYRATVQDDEKGVDPAWQAGFVPGRRYAINVIDRADGKLKILEKGSTVFKKFADYKSIIKKDPAGKDGPNFAIRVTVPMKDGKPHKMKTEYGVQSLPEPAPFTTDEIKMIKEKGLWPLVEIYKSTPAEKMKEMWDALPAEKKIAPKKDAEDDDDGSGKDDAKTSDPTKQVKPIEEKMEKAPAEEEDIFAEDNDPVNTEASGELF